jgi:hypothetical protein
VPDAFSTIQRRIYQSGDLEGILRQIQERPEDGK